MSSAQLEEARALYSKLYDEYKKIKTNKFSEMVDVNKDQEVKFANCISAGDRFIQQLRTENDKLKSQLNELRSEVASNRSTTYQQCTEYQKRLMEENRKNVELFEEVERLRTLQSAGNVNRSKDSKTDNGELCTPASGQVSGEAGNLSQRRKTNKRRRHSQSKTEDIVLPSSSRQGDEILIGLEKDLHKESVSSGALITVQQPQCCRTTESPGGDVNPTGQANCISPPGQANCMFQVLLEYLVGFKFSTVNQTGEICISAVHQSSGYSFSLTWVNRGAGKEAELLYRVFSLGSLERVASEWMKDTIMFTTTMLPKFFERLSCVFNMQS